jgi:hypothetical protein
VSSRYWCLSLSRTGLPCQVEFNVGSLGSSSLCSDTGGVTEVSRVCLEALADIQRIAGDLLTAKGRVLTSHALLPCERSPPVPSLHPGPALLAFDAAAPELQARVADSGLTLAAAIRRLTPRARHPLG